MFACNDENEKNSIHIFKLPVTITNMIISYLSIIGIMILSVGVIFSAGDAFGQTDYTTGTTITVNVNGAQPNGLLPVIVVQNMTSSAYFPNNLSMLHIYFEPYLNQGTNQTSIVQATRLNFTATNVDKQNIITYASNGFLISDDMVYSLPVSCNDKLKNADFGKFFLSIKNTTSVIVNYSDTRLKQDHNGTYHLQFASFSDVKIKLPLNAHIIANETDICNQEKTGQQINLYNMSFYLVNYHPIPEFSFTTPSLLISVTLLAAFYMVKNRKIYSSA